jgi:hypothetical protein
MPVLKEHVMQGCRKPLSSACPGRIAPARSRREFLATASNGFGMLALAGLLAESAE